MSFIIDRIEDGVAVLEADDGTISEMPASGLPEGAGEGDCLTVTEDGVITVDADETAHRRRMNAELFRSLLED